MKIHYDSQDIVYKNPFGAVKEGDNICFNIRLLQFDDIPKVYLVIVNDDNCYETLNMCHDSDEFFSCKYLADKKGLYYYYFKIETIDSIKYYGNNSEGLGGVGELFLFDPHKYQLLVFENQYIPKWLQEGVVYQIFPDRFNRGENWKSCQKKAEIKGDMFGAKRIIINDWNRKPFYIKNVEGDVTEWPFFGGNLKGIIDKLDYLKNMGVSIIYLNPIFKALSNHKYDTWDYMEIDPSFGDESEFIELCNISRSKGIKIVLDGVFNHVGAASPYFDKYKNFNDGACSGQDSPYYDWFTFFEFPDEYEAWWGIKDLPQIKKTQKNFQRYIYKVVKNWIELGASGFRLDVADELSDDFIKGIRKSIKEINDDAILIGEVWDDASNKISYGDRKQYFLGQELDGVMNYLFRDWIIAFVLKQIEADEFCKRTNNIYEHYPFENLISSFNILGSHDRKRIITILGEAPLHLNEKAKGNYMLDKEKRELAIKRYELALAILYFLPGVPTIYYGDEIGNEGYEDPYNRGTVKWDSIETRIIEVINKFSLLRKSHKELVYGEYLPVGIDKNILLIERNEKFLNQYVALAVNTSNKDKKFSIHTKNINEEFFVKANSYLLINN
ncbi:MAG TPA: glycoside hydrolase family 13 protein [Anaerovoracaceae bacterium]|nr:glycoside hydrolase family 13 protein [Anaerovoracaceae bacterium]